jgi:hypothetical protein
VARALFYLGPEILDVLPLALDERKAEPAEVEPERRKLDDHRPEVLLLGCQEGGGADPAGE